MSQNIKNLTISASFTRRSDMAVYAAEDVVNNSTSSPAILTFSASPALTSGKSIILKTLKVCTDNATVTNGSFRINVFKESVTPIADNAAWTLLYANRSKKVGYIDFTLTTGGTGSDASEAIITDVNIPFKLASEYFYGVLVAKAAYVPTSGQNFNFEFIAHEIDG